MNREQISQLEAMAEKAYNPALPDSKQAEQTLNTIFKTPDVINQCRFILENSSQPQLQLFSASTLLNVFPTLFSAMPKPQILDLRNFLLSYLANRAGQIFPPVASKLTTLVCRITKLSWNDDPVHREFVAEVSKFLTHTIAHCVAGLRILSELVTEMHTCPAFVMSPCLPVFHFIVVLCCVVSCCLLAYTCK